MSLFLQSILVGVTAMFCGGRVCELFVWAFKNPLVGGAVVGLILGRFTDGLIIGATIQLVYMGEITVGGITSFDKGYAGVIAPAVTILSNQSPEIGVTLAVTLGVIGLMAGNVSMTVNSVFVHMADKYVATGETKHIWIYNWLLPELIYGLVYGLPAFLCCYYGAEVFETVMNSLPAQIITALKAVGSVLPALGIGMMLKAVYKPRFVAFAIIGFVLVAYLHLDIIACSLVAIACAILYWTLGLDKLAE